MRPQTIGALERGTLLKDSISKANVVCGTQNKTVYSFYAEIKSV